MFRVTTWGESHGPALGATVDGCPPGLVLSEADIQPFMDARKPGQNKYTTQRREADVVRILSGVYEGRTTGTPIQLMIENTDQRSKDYSEISQKCRLHLFHQIWHPRPARRRAFVGARNRGAGGGWGCGAGGFGRAAAGAENYRLYGADGRA